MHRAVGGTAPWHYWRPKDGEMEKKTHSRREPELHCDVIDTRGFIGTGATCNGQAKTCSPIYHATKGVFHIAKILASETIGGVLINFKEETMVEISRGQRLKLTDIIPNGQTQSLEEHSDDVLYDLLMAEYPKWVQEAKAKELIR